MAGEDTTIEGTDRDIGEFLVKRGIITPHQLEQVLKAQKEDGGKKLGDLLVNAGFIKDTAIIDALRIQTRVIVRCTGCGKEFQVYYYNPASNYTCKTCGAALQTNTGTDPTFVLTPTQGDGEKKAGPKRMEPQLPPEVEIAARDHKRVFGKYVIVKELGRGGAAVVYKAWDKNIAQYVALKFIRSQEMVEGEGTTSTDSESASNEIQDFQREARMAARLRHPNIVRIYELGTYDNKHYLAMDLMEGGSFFNTIHGAGQRNTDTLFNVEPQKFLKIMRDVCYAVYYAHTQDPPVIHRDLKPHNILMDAKGVPYVADFGLAKEVNVGKSETVTGVVKGTPAYMAPEQAEGHSRDTDQQTDIYSLGAILYEILTGRPPFTGQNVRQILNQIVVKIPDRPNEAIAKSLQEQPTGVNRPKPVARELETICLKALEKRKIDRYKTAKDLGDDINRYLEQKEIEAREPGILRKFMRKARAHPLLSGSIAAVLLCGIIIFATLKLLPKKEGVDIEKVLVPAREALQKKDYSGMRGAIEPIRGVDPRHPLIKELESTIAAWEADTKARRDQWKAGLAKLPTGNLKANIDALRPLYRSSEEGLKSDFTAALSLSLRDIQGAVTGDARKLFGAGPRVEWYTDAKQKAEAKVVRERLAHLMDLSKDADFPFGAAAEVPGLRDGMDRLLAYEGLWDLRVNVAPFAHVTVRKGSQEVAQEWTPWGQKGFEVGQGYTVELCWPDQKNPQKKVVKQIGGLKHEMVVVLKGDITKGEVE